MVWRELSPEDLYGLGNPLIIDVRSPCEYREERIPGAVNIPLLSDSERALIGTIYKEAGEFNARIRAVSIISPKIPGIIDEILNLKEHSRSLVIHCWRGGLRSEAVASFLSISGISSFRLTGGYKAWRAVVARELSENRFDFKAVVLHGFTGAGKTEILNELQALNCQVLDLEDLANHRGSVFGGLGKEKQPSQKNFEGFLWQKLASFDLTQAVFLEGESRKIGRISLPDPIVEKISKGKAILVESGLEARAKRIMGDYLFGSVQREQRLQESMTMLESIKERLGKARLDEILEHLRKGDNYAAVQILLSDYYDPLYRKSIKKRVFDLTITSDDSAEAAGQIKRWVEQTDLKEKSIARS